MQVKIKHLLFPIFLTLAGCGIGDESMQNATQADEVIRINTSNIKDTLNLSHLIESIEVIPLQEKKGFFLGEINKVFQVDDGYVVIDEISTSQVLLFDRAGKFVKRIIGPGTGRNDALQINDGWVNPNGQVCAYDAATKKVFYFNKSHTFKRASSNGKNFYHNLIQVPNSNDFLGYSATNDYNPAFNHRHFQLELLNDKLEVIDGFLPIKGRMRGSYFLSFFSHLVLYGDSVRVLRTYDNIVYNYWNKKLAPRFMVEYVGGKTLTYNVFEDVVKNNDKAFFDQRTLPTARKAILKDYSYLRGDWIEDKRYAMFSSASGQKQIVSIYDKEKKQEVASAALFYENNKYNIFLPRLTNSTDGYFFGVINSVYLKTYLRGESSLSKYTDPSYNSFLIVKIKLKK